MNRRLSLLCSWIIITFVDLFIVRNGEWVLEHFSTQRFQVNYAVSALGMLAFLYLLRPLVKKNCGILWGWGLLAVPMAIQTSYFSVYREFVPSIGVSAFAEDPVMVLDLWVHNAPFLRIILASALLFTAVRLLERGSRGHWFGKCLSVFYLIIFALLATLSWYSVPLFQNAALAWGETFLNITKQRSIEHFVLKRPKVAPSSVKADVPNMVFVIGESTTLTHMSLYGYERDTTPGLCSLAEEDAVISLHNAISIGTKTRLSVPYMLSGLTGIDPGGVYYHTPTLFNYAKARGYTTALVTAQDLYWGHMKEMIVDGDVDRFINGTQYNPDASVHKGGDDLMILEKEVLPFMESAPEPWLLVVQMDGSHYPYTEHSPPGLKKFLPEDEPNGRNAYDNTVVITDLFLSRLIRILRWNDPGAWLFFSPDHGQNLGGDNGFFNEGFSSAVIHNPLLVSPPLAYVPMIKALENAPVSQADIVPTLIALMGMVPITLLDGVSLLEPVDPDRLRVCSEWMPTYHSDPNAVLVFPDLTHWYFNFSRMSVVLADGETMIPFDDVPVEYKTIFTKRMEGEASPGPSN